MLMILNKIIFFIFLLVIAAGTVCKIYTRKRLSEIDGLSPIIRQDLEQEYIIGEFGEEP